LFGEMFKARTGIDIIHVPYRGQVPALDDLIAGRIGVMFPIMPDVIEATDEVRALALASTEVSGVPSGCAIDAAARLSRSRRLGLDRALRSCANARTVIERLRAQTQALTASADFAGMRPEEFAAFTQQERGRWAKVIASLGLSLQ
jgi:tripartite-type tricarboxylate transporter receptor subunit TctC